MARLPGCSVGCLSGCLLGGGKSGEHGAGEEGAGGLEEFSLVHGPVQFGNVFANKVQQGIDNSIPQCKVRDDLPGPADPEYG